MNERVWRPTLLSRVMLVAFGLGEAWFGIWLVGVARSEGDTVIGLLFAIAVAWVPAAVALRAAVRLRICAGHGELGVVTLFAEHHIPWSAVERAEVGYRGVTIILRDGGSVLSGAVQKSNAARRFGWKTRGDEVAGIINQRAREDA